MLTKRELSLYKFKSMDCFFTQNLINKGNQNHEFATEFDEEQSRFLRLKRKEDRIEYFKTKESPRKKYKMWKAVDMLHRYSQQQRVYPKAKYANRQENSMNEDKNLMTKLIAQIERPISEDIEKKGLDYVVTKIAELDQAGRRSR